jgi:hypothetical protein
MKDSARVLTCTVDPSEPLPNCRVTVVDAPLPPSGGQSYEGPDGNRVEFIGRATVDARGQLVGTMSNVTVTAKGKKRNFWLQEPHHSRELARFEARRRHCRAVAAFIAARKRGQRQVGTSSTRPASCSRAPRRRVARRTASSRAASRGDPPGPPGDRPREGIPPAGPFRDHADDDTASVALRAAADEGPRRAGLP